MFLVASLGSRALCPQLLDFSSKPARLRVPLQHPKRNKWLGRFPQVREKNSSLRDAFEGLFGLSSRGPTRSVNVVQHGLVLGEVSRRRRRSFTQECLRDIGDEAGVGLGEGDHVTQHAAEVGWVVFPPSDAEE
jgi:hypothetical protein